MTESEVLDYFAKKYPSKNIVKLPEDNPQEIICEIDPTAKHPGYNVAIAAIRQSVPHHHNHAVETYEVMQGKLALTIDDDTVHLRQGDTYTVFPPQVHSAKGDFMLVKVRSEPGWTPEDHILEVKK